MKSKTDSKKPDSKQETLVKECIEQFDADNDAVEPIRKDWASKENLIIGKLEDSITQETNNRVNAPELLNMVYKRTNSSMAQLPTGKIQVLSKKDTGKNAAMNLVWNKYVLPNARTQQDIFTKAWFLQFYSYTYGAMPALVDYVVSDKYVGPDFYVLEQRNFIPQRGRYSIQDMDRGFVVSKVSRSWLEGRDVKTWKNIDKLLEKANNKGGGSVDQSAVKIEYGSDGGILGKGNEDIEIITRYEGDRWVTFSKDAKVILRDIPNQHHNGELPIVMKQAFPLIDRLYGLGEMERGQTLQYALNSLVNLYMEGVKMSIFPPMKIYLPDVVASTILNEPGAKWVLKNSNPNAILDHNRSPLGMNTFQSTYQFLKGSLMGLAQTSDTTMSESSDVGFGKTPQALKMQAAFDSSRSNFDRKMLEIALQDIFEKMINLIPTKQEKPIKMSLFAEDLKLIQDIHPDLVEMFESGKYGEVVIKPSNLRDSKDTKYKFFIDPGTTVRKDEAIESETVSVLLDKVMKIPGAPEQAAQTGKVRLGNKNIDVAELFKRSFITSGIQDWEKIVTEISPEEMQPTQPQNPQGGPQAPQQGQMPGMDGTGPMMQQPQVNFEQPQAQQAFQGMPQQGGLSPESEQLLASLGKK